MDSQLKAPRKTILVVEDTALVLNTVRMILERAKFTVLAAASADEAMRLAGSARTIHLLLSDVMMPDMSGPDLAQKLKALRPEMRVILMSGYPDGAMLRITVIEIACATLYAIPRTSVLGAILLTGYLGGATATHVRVGEPFFLPVIVGIVLWLGLYLRDHRVCALVPFRSEKNPLTNP